MADCAICSGVTGTAGLRPGVSAEPVTAHEIITFRCMPPPPCAPILVATKPSARTGPKPRGSHAQHGSSPWSAKLMRGRLSVARVARGASSGRPPGLPPIVHCAKPPRARLGTNPICDEGDFASAYGSLAAGRAFFIRAGTSEVSSPMNELLLDYLPLVIFIAVALGISVGLLIVPFVIAYKAPDPEKLSAYECGFNAFDDARMKFDVRFYLVAILFIIFDLEM